jgi:hypothetical protein
MYLRPGSGRRKGSFIEMPLLVEMWSSLAAPSRLLSPTSGNQIKKLQIEQGPREVPLPDPQVSVYPWPFVGRR